MRSLSASSILISTFTALALVACGGGGAKVKSEITTTTKGQQLMDLKKAMNDGAITQDEYDSEKKRILTPSD